MYSFPWGEPGTDLEEHDGPDDWQRDQLNRVSAKIIADTIKVIIAWQSSVSLKR